MDSGAPVPIETLLAHRGWVRGLARSLVRDEHAAEDLEQQVWVDALRCPPTRGERLRGWFATVLRRRARDAWRAEDRRGRREAAAARPDRARATAAIVAEAEAHRRVVEALLALEEPYRETILLRFYEDLPPREVAARAGVPVETVRTRTRRALDRMRERLDGTHAGDRSAWIAVVAPLGGLRLETGAAVAASGGATVANGAAATAVAGGAAMGTKVAVAAGLAGAAVGAVLGGTVGSGGKPPESPAEVAALRARVAELEAAAPAPQAPGKEVQSLIAEKDRRITRLEADLEEARRVPREAAVPSPPDPADRPEVPPGGKESPESAVTRLRRELEKVREANAELDASIAADARSVFLDRTRSADERAVALSKLRTRKGIDREIVAAAVDLYRGSEKAGIREWLLRDLHGTKDPVLQGLFLEALRDPDAKVRERAARDIDDYLDDPSVVAALEALRDGDPSEEVRRRAIRTLASKGEKDDD